MGCCGKNISRILNTGVNIGTGYANLAIGRKPTGTDAKIRACWNCPENTWLTMAEYVGWYKRNGIDLIKNALDFEKTPPLPKFERGRGRNNLFCRLCKCYVPAKARVAGERCRLGRWERTNGKSAT